MTVEELLRERPTLTGFTGLFTDVGNGSNAVINVDEDGIYVGPIGNYSLSYVTVGSDDACSYVTDGVADNVQIQEAIDFISLVGGAVQLLPQDYDIRDTIVHKANVWIRGAGVYVSRLVLHASTNKTVIKSYLFDTYTGTGTITNLSNGLALSDLMIDGNKASQSSGSGAQYYTAAPIFNNVLFYNCKDNGLYTEYSNNDSTITQDPQRHVEGVFFNVYTVSNGNDGFVMRGPHDSVLTNCNSHLNGRYGFYVTASTNQSAGGTVMMGCHSWGNGSDPLRVGDNSSSSASLLANNCELEGQFGVAANLLQAGSNKLVGCKFFVCPTGVSIQGNDNLIESCQWTQCGVGVQLGDTGNSVSGNDVSGHILMVNRSSSPHATQTAIDNKTTGNANNKLDITGYSSDALNVYVATQESTLLTLNKVSLYFNGAAGNYKLFTVDRLLSKKGVSIAAANTLTLGRDGSSFTITGNTQINVIKTDSYIPGSEVTLIFTGTPTIKHNTAGAGSPLLLSGGVDFTVSNPTVLKIIYDGSFWQEISRSINHA